MQARARPVGIHTQTGEAIACVRMASYVVKERGVRGGTKRMREPLEGTLNMLLHDWLLGGTFAVPIRRFRGRRKNFFLGHLSRGKKGDPGVGKKATFRPKKKYLTLKNLYVSLC